MKKIAIMFIALTAAVAAQATVSVDVKARFLKDETGLTNAAKGTLSYLIVDLDGNGIGDLNNVDGSSYKFDANDTIIASAGISASLAGYASVFAGTKTHADNGGVLKTGDDVWLVWFPHITGTTTVGGPGENQYFGALKVTDITANGGTATYNVSTLAQAATYQTIPEPATALLVAVGGGMVWAARRAKRFHNYES